MPLARLNGSRRLCERAVGWGKKLPLVAEKGRQANDKSELLLQAYFGFLCVFVFF